MDRTPQSSSLVASIGYDDAANTLEVEFRSGAIYQYFGVPQNMYEQLMQAPSKGQFINTYIKNAYAYSRVG
jgi:hypothetical protein